jgi:hypothetical protein
VIGCCDVFLFDREDDASFAVARVEANLGHVMWSNYIVAV